MSLTPRSSDLLPLAAAGALLYFAANSIIRNKRRIGLRNKTVLITGGSRGLGLVLARRFLAKGAKVAVCARDQQELDAASRQLANHPFAAFRCDLTQRPQVEQLIADVEARFGPIDILINNAGTITVAPAELMTERDYREAMELHFFAPLYTTLAVLPSMRERRSGRIVNISSIGGKIPVPHLAPYVASKFALTGFSETLRAELAKDNILVTTVCPGLMRTGSPRNVGVKGRYQEEFAWFILGDSLPGASMSARRAAEKIIDAAVHGDPEIVLSLPAKAAALLHGIAPALFTRLITLQNALLPKPPEKWDSGQGARKRRGHQSHSWLTRSPLTALTQQAAAQNNEL
ncbi:MAG TPA: SDR family NAD(P)-dependent oxidoreductase [Phycisphaerae bacterium]|nr:SDR family NAD(P)-dependent oxidoreductase [Phycisphaerae bacterium]